MLMGRPRSDRVCSIEGCGRPHYAFGWCNMHYSRHKATGQTSRGACDRRLYGVEDIDWDVLPHDNARAAVARYLTGESRDQVAADFGVAPGTVAMWVSRSRRSPKRADAYPLDRDELKRLVAAGRLIEDLCVRFDCSEGHVRNEINRHGLAPAVACQREEWMAEKAEKAEAEKALREMQVQSRRDWYARREAALVSDYESGSSLTSLAIRYRIDQSQAWRILQRNGVDTSRRRGVARATVPRRWSRRLERLRATPDLVVFS